jgi:hypothetical protein
LQSAEVSIFTLLHEPGARRSVSLAPRTERE